MVPELVRHPRENKERIQWAYDYVLDLRLQGHTLITANKKTLSWDTYEGVQLNEGERARQERPMSAHHVPHAILSAWCVAEDNATKEKLWQLIEDYRATFAMAKRVQHVAYWKEAPKRLREIPRFTFCYAEKDAQISSIMRMEGGAEAINTPLDNFCCIL